MAEALYRKYRPQVFDDVVGQDHIERTLKNALDRDRVSHAYLFTGPRGTGKTTTARLLAKALLCEHGPTSSPCGICEDCLLIAAGEHPDVFELDAASRTGVDNVREEIIGRVQYAPTRGSRKIYIIDEVHMLSPAAFNALLKTLEEPPAHVVFILCTTDPQKVLETVQSRCQRFDFRRIAPEMIVSRLGAVCMAEGVEFEGEALDLIAHRAEGGMRDALTALEQILVYGGGTATLAAAEQVLGSLKTSDMAELVDAIGRRDAAAAFRWVARFAETGADLAHFTRDLIAHMRDMYLLCLAGHDAELETSEEQRAQLVRELPLFGPDRLAYVLGVLGDLQMELRTASNARLSFEIACTRMARPSCDLTLQSLAARIEALEAAMAEAMGGRGSCRAVPFQGQDHKKALEGHMPATRDNAVAASAVPDASMAHAHGNVYAGAGGSSNAVSYSADEAGAGSRVAPSSDASGVSNAMKSSVDVANAAQPAAHHAPGGFDFQNNAALQRAWQQVLGIIKREKTAYGVLFMNTRAVHADGRLNIEFAADNEFAFKAVQKPEIGEALENALRQVFGSEIAFTFVKANAANAAGAQADASSAAATGAQAGASSSARVPAGSNVAEAVHAPSSEVRVGATAAASPSIAPASDDEVPLDVYESYADYSEDAYGARPPWDEPPAAPLPAAAPAAASAPSTVPEPRHSAAQAPPAQTPLDDDAASAGTAGVDGPDGLQDALSLFGNVRIEEI